MNREERQRLGFKSDEAGESTSTARSGAWAERFGTVSRANPVRRIVGSFGSTVVWEADELEVRVGRPRPTWSIGFALLLAAYAALMLWSARGEVSAGTMATIAVALLPYEGLAFARILASRRRAVLGHGRLVLRGPWAHSTIGVDAIERFVVRSRGVGQDLRGWRHDLVAELASGGEACLISLSSVRSSTELSEVEAAMNARLSQRRASRPGLARLVAECE